MLLAIGLSSTSSCFVRTDWSSSTPSIPLTELRAASTSILAEVDEAVLRGLLLVPLLEP